MDPRVSNMQTFSIAVPGIAKPITSEDAVAGYSPGLLSAIPDFGGRFDYSEGQLSELLGETQPVIHRNLDQTIYTRHMNALLAERGNGLAPAWSVASIVTLLGGIGASMIYRFGGLLSMHERGTIAMGAVLLMGVAGVSYLAAIEASKLPPKSRSYSYFDMYTSDSHHVKWKEYWRSMLVEGCDRQKLGQVGRRAKSFGFKLSQLRKPMLSNKHDGTDLSGDDVWKFMMYLDDAGFADITSLLWSIEAARRSVGKPLRMQIKAMPDNAAYFLKLGQALSGRQFSDLSLTDHSQSLADLLSGVVYYSGFGNKVPTQAAAVSALLGRYYLDQNSNHNASLMMHSMKYALMGKWGSAYNVHMSALKRSVAGVVDVEKRAVTAIHHLGIARLMQERVIEGYGQKIIPSAYAYAFSAAQAFNSIACEIDEAPLYLQMLMMRSLEIMRVMSDNGPFVGFK